MFALALALLALQHIERIRYQGTTTEPMFTTLQYNVEHQTLQQLLNAICTTDVVPPACLFPIQNNAMKIKSCQKVCAAVPKEADCSTLYGFPCAVVVAPSFFPFYRRNRSISSSFSPPPPYLP